MEHRPEFTTTFQGLDIAVENNAGSTRHWSDPHSGEAGSTTMVHPYGFIYGTLGTDGDEVDVYIGPDWFSQDVYIVTQMKKPDFKEIDEQKVMLGFSSELEAKKAYLLHFNDDRFFGSMKKMSMSEFKAKLTNHKGKLIKHLYAEAVSANIHSNSVSYSLEDPHMSNADLFKALSARFLSFTKNARRAMDEHAAAASEKQPEIFATEEVQVLPLHAFRPHEPPPVPVVHVPTPMQSGTLTAPDFMTSCDSCGYTHKSLSSCPRCDQVREMNKESTPIWRR
ncbi:hypothetical protein HC928_00265 [bacterium]|nr:hypothetical protein [bacterium]